MLLSEMKVYLETMGCQMNVLDSELVASMLRSAGMELTDDARSADVVLYNTCSVRQHAEEKVHSRLGWACRRKSDGRAIVIGVLGCMAQRLGEQLLRRHEGLDIVCGPGSLARLVELIQRAHSGPQVALDPARRRKGGETALGAGGDDGCLEYLEGKLDRQRDPANTHLPGQAYVRVMRGCDKFCSYCIVPYVRGRERSRSPRSILEELRRLAGAGVTQVTLLGQTVNSYRFTVAGRTVGLAELLEAADGVAGLRRIRFLTSYPADFDVAILQAVRDLPKVCEYLHLPAQSGSDRVLRAMNRRYSRAEYDELIDRARQTVPDIAIAGDFIVGFPGETEEDFAASADLIRRSQYKNSYIFKYSPRPGTAAHRKGVDDVPEQVKRHRNHQLLAVQREVSLAGNHRLVGKTVEVLVEGRSPRSGDRLNQPANPRHVQLAGRTRTDHIVIFEGPETLAGEYVHVKVAEAKALGVFGALAGTPQRTDG